MNLSVYESCLTSKVYGNVTDEEVFDYIKKNKNAEFVRKQHGTKKYANEKVKLPSLTWAGRFNEVRNSNSLIESSGYIYFDIDNYTDKDLIADIPEVKAVWLSLSGKGIGGIFRANVDKNSYSSTYNDFGERYKLKLDKTSDVSRVNIISYDKDIIIKDNPEVYPTILKEIREYTVKDNVSNDYEEVCSLAYNSALTRGYQYKIGGRDHFCSYYFYMTNLFGSELDHAVNYLFMKGLTSYYDFNIQSKAISIYSRNRDKFNTQQLNTLNGLLRTK